MPTRLHRHHVFLALLAAFALRAEPGIAQQQDMSGAAGDWVFRMDGDASPQRVALTATGDSVRGQVYGQQLAGTLQGQRLTFRVGDYRWTATLRGDSLRGWLGIGADSSRWSAGRYRPRPVARAFSHVPTSYHRELATSVTPALRLYAGDTVRTTTVDAGGWGRGAFGQRTNKLTRGGNPLTGPFYVEGTIPGDVLVVRLLRVRLNRDWAFSGTALIDNAIEPGYAAARKPSDVGNQWALDTVANVARLKNPPPRLSGFSVPLRPFLGVVAVAPGDGVVPSSRDSGPYGGNMEYARLTDGATLYLPVTEEGAYLYLGDGHAAQGDGELTGDAMETSLDIEFTVGVQRGRYAGATRAESAEQLMSIGVAGSLDQALRQATSDLARWLEAEYGLTATEAALVMGFAVAYDIPDVVPPWVSVVARVPRAALAQLKR